MAKKGFIKDLNDVEILPITRGELVIDSSGKEAFHSNEFLATTSLPGLMSAEDKNKLDNLEGGIKYDIVSTTADGLAPKINTTASTITTQTDEWILTTTKGATPSWRKLPVNAFLNRPISVNGTSILENNNTALNLVAGNNITLVPEKDTGKVTIHSNITNITGNAATADKLKNKVKLWGLEFDGSKDVSGTLSNVGAIIRTEPNAVDSNAVGNLQFKSTAVDNAAWHVMISDTNHLFTVKKNGNVGIGTTSPEYKLDVNGDAMFTGTVTSSVATGTAPFNVSSKTLVSNLNADMLDGQHASRFIGLYTRADIGTAPNYDNPSVNGLFEMRESKEVPNETGTKPVNIFAPFFSIKSENVMMQITGRTYNNSGWYIRGKQDANVTLEGVSWERLVIEDAMERKWGISVKGNAATATKLKTAVKLWGNDFDGIQSLSDTIIINNKKPYASKKADGTTLGLMYLNGNGNLIIGQDVAKNTTSTYIFGHEVRLCYGTTGSTKVTGLKLELGGDVAIPNGLTIGSETHTNSNFKLDVNGNTRIIGTSTFDNDIYARKSINVLNSLSHPLIISRINDNKEITKIYQDDNGLVFDVTNDEKTSRVYWNFTATDVENSDGTDAKSGTLHFGINSSSRTYFAANEFLGNLNGIYVNALTGYTKATTAADLVETDTLNIALGKLEYKSDIAYSWYRSITLDDTDEIINKWDEVVDFVNGLEVDLTDEFVTRKTNLVITGVKTFLNGSNNGKIKLENGDIISSLNVDGPWTRHLYFGNTSGNTSVMASFGVVGSGINSNNENKIHYVYIAHQDLNHNSASFRVYADRATILSNEIYHKGNLKNLSDLNDDVVSGKYLPLSGGTMTGPITLTSGGLLANDKTALSFISTTGTELARIGTDINNHLGLYSKGTIYIRPNHALTTSNINGIILSSTQFTYNTYNVLHEGNYTSYTVKKDGTGATGTWNIGLTGKNITSEEELDALINKPFLVAYIENSVVEGFSDGIILSTGVNNRWGHLIYLDDNREIFRRRSKNGEGSAWYPWRDILDSGNYTSYTVKKDGTGATGTWSINITGSAESSLRCYPLDSLLKYINEYTVEFVKEEIVKLLAKQSGGVGYNITVPSTVINNWNDPSYITSPGSAYSLIKISGSYSGSTFGLWLLSSYADKRLGYVGRNNDVWSSIKWLATTEDIDSLRNYYWADIKISSNANANTSPTFAYPTSKYLKFTNGTEAIGYVGRGSSNNNLYFANYKNSDVSIYTDNNETRCIYLKTGGNVGIGTTNPDYKLEVNGTTATSKLIINTSIRDHSTPLEQCLLLYSSPVPSDSSLTLKNAPGIGFYVYGSTWGSLVYNTNFHFLANDHANYRLVYAKGFVKQDSSDSYVLLGGGGHKAISDFLLKSELANLELSNNLTTITKELTVTQDWMDTGIKYTDLPASGTYIVQVYVKANDGTGGMYNCYWSGIMSWNIGGTSDDESDEILLHRSGHAYYNTIYLRTIMSSNSDGSHLRLLIAANRNIGAAYTYTFKFKRII